MATPPAFGCSAARGFLRYNESIVCLSGSRTAAAKKVVAEGFRVIEGAEELLEDDRGPGLRCRASEFFTPPGHKQGDAG